jgi:hypothetical protein
VACLQFLVALPAELVKDNHELLAAPVRLALIAGVSYLPLACECMVWGMCVGYSVARESVRNAPALCHSCRDRCARHVAV